MRRLLEGHSGIITGAGSGIGRATALELGRQGAWVLVTDRVEAGGRETLRLLREQGSEGEFLLVDIADLAQLEAAVKHAVAARGRLDYIVNNAGMPMPVPAHEITLEQFEQVIDVNLRGTFFACKYALERMLAQDGGGAIVNMASDMGLVAGLPNQPAYCASKGGVVMLTKALGTDYAARGIRVNCVCPCLTDTPGIDDFLERQFPDADERAAVKSDLHGMQPIGRMNTVQEVADAIVFLVSPMASGLTAVALPVDGGFVAR